MSPNELFRKLNAEFFDGKLPKYRVTLFTFPSDTHGEIDRKRMLIRIARHLAKNPKDLRRSLLHEMCHIRSEYHGKLFLEELKRLGQRGEVWAIHEMRGYRDAASWNEMMSNLAGFVEDVARENPNIPFRKILGYSADDFGMTPSELLKASPWLPRTWENAKQDLEDSKQK